MVIIDRPTEAAKVERQKCADRTTVVDCKQPADRAASRRFWRFTSGTEAAEAPVRATEDAKLNKQSAIELIEFKMPN